MTIECDVLVVGAGPAGSSAARAAALGGATTILLDKKTEIGVPVQCAEGIGSHLIPFLPFQIPKEQLIWKIDGISFYINDVTIERSGGMWSGYAINREQFDKWLTENAVKAGANLQLNSELIDVETDNNYKVKKAIVRIGSNETVIKPKVVIAADGVDSTVLGLLGFTIDPDKTGYVYSHELQEISFKKPNYDHMFFGDFAPGGYGYVFPLSKDRANVGIAALFKKKSIEKFYEEFIEILKYKGVISSEGKIVSEKKGVVPFISQTENWRYGNVLLAGDAANQNIKPLVEGILPSVICGNFAGEISSKSSRFDISLEIYERSVSEFCNEFFEYSEKLSTVLYETGSYLEDKYHLLRLGLASNLISIDELNKLKDEGYNKIKKVLLNRYLNQ